MKFLLENVKALSELLSWAKKERLENGANVQIKGNKSVELSFFDRNGDRWDTLSLL